MKRIPSLLLPLLLHNTRPDITFVRVELFLQIFVIMAGMWLLNRRRYYADTYLQGQWSRDASGSQRFLQSYQPFGRVFF